MVSALLVWWCTNVHLSFMYLTDVSFVVVLHRHHSHTGNWNRESLFATRRSVLCGDDKPGRQLWSVIVGFFSSCYSWQSCQLGRHFYPSGITLALFASHSLCRGKRGTGIWGGSWQFKLNAWRKRTPRFLSANSANSALLCSNSVRPQYRSRLDYGDQTRSESDTDYQ